MGMYGMFDILEALFVFAIGLGILAVAVYVLFLPSLDFGTTDAIVKVQEVGIKYLFVGLGQYNYIRIQNAYSDQYSASSESWETCISAQDMAKFTEFKNSRIAVNIKVQGIGWGSLWSCATGDHVVSWSES